MFVYHVLHNKYQEGQPIYCLDEALREGVLEQSDLAEWAEDVEEYQDPDIICVMETLEEAKEWAEENEQIKIAKIEVEDEDDLIENEEGYKAFNFEKIRPEFIKEVIEIG